MKTPPEFDYIRTIASVRSISAAADELGISQPALSLYLKKTERTLGVKLFDRRKQPLEITEYGFAYLEYLDRLAALNREMSQNFADIDGLNAGQLSVGASSYFNVAVMPKAIAEFNSRFPNIDIEIIDGKVPELVNRAQRGTLDLFVTPFADDSDRFKYVELFEERIYLAVPPDHPINRDLAGKAILPDCEAEPLTRDEFIKLCELTFIILKDDQQIGQMARELFAEAGAAPARTLTAEQTMTTLALTESGVGVSLIAESSINGSSRKEMPALYLADSSITRRRLYAASPRSKYLSKAASTFIGVLQQTTDTQAKSLFDIKK